MPTTTTTRTPITADKAADLLAATGRVRFADNRGGRIQLAHLIRMARHQGATVTRIEDSYGRVKLSINCHLGYGATTVTIKEA